MSEWPEITLKNAGVGLIDCDHKTPKAQETGLPYIGIPQLKNGRITLDGARLITEDDFHHWRRKADPKENDVILSRRCNPGEIAYVPPNLDIALGQNLVLLRSDGEKVYPPFLRWITQGPNWWHQVNKYINVGAVFDSLKCADIPKFEFKLPPKEVQIEISKILGDLDEKILVNNDSNLILEDMARTIFKSWFVNFDPTRAKIIAKKNGQEPELAAMATIAGKGIDELETLDDEKLDNLKSIAALFPDNFEDSELGEIPEGWEVKQFDDICHAKQGKYIAKDKMIDVISEEYSCAVWGGNGIRGYSRNYLYEDPVVVLTCRGSNCGLIELTGNNSWVSNISFGCSPKIGSVYYLHLLFSQMDFSDCISGSAQPQITYSSIKNKQIAYPFDVAVIDKFSDFLNGLYLKIEQNKKQNKVLDDLRETLLPKLLSGELNLSSEAVA